MKLRIRENSVRLRLTQSEVSEIAKVGLVENRTEFGKANFVYSIKTSDSIQNLQAVFENGEIEIIIPKSMVENWANNEEVGIFGEIGSLKVLVEKDFKCLTPRAGDEDTDTFPHPKEGSHDC